LEIQKQSNPGQRSAQKALAHEVTSLVHGPERTDSVERVTRVLFGENQFDSLSSEDLETLSDEIPTSRTGQSIIEVLSGAGIVASNGEAKRLIESGAITVNGQKVESDIRIENTCLVKKGKNSFVLVRSE